MFSTKEILQRERGKWLAAEWIVKNLPSHDCYVEPFGGSCAVLMSKIPSNHEVYNDRNNDIVTLFNVIRDDKMRLQLLRLMAMTPYSRVELDFAKEYEYMFKSDRDRAELGQSAIMIAHQLLVRSHMSIVKRNEINGIGFNADSSKFAPTVKELWSDLPDSIIMVTERFRQVIIENTDAYNIIKQHDRKDALFYLDPPEVLTDKKQVDLFDKDKMTVNAFNNIMKLVNKSDGMFVLNAVDNEFYNDTLNGWKKEPIPYTGTSTSKRKKGGGKCLWLSPECQSTQMDMFV